MISSLKSIVKIALQSRRVTIPRIASGKGRQKDRHTPILIMGNGPSLNTTMEQSARWIASHPAMAVNFAANSPAFASLHPSYYLLADPLFFPSEAKSSSAPATPSNVAQLQTNLMKVDWPMTLFVPRRHLRRAREMYGQNPSISLATFNPVGVEGWQWLENLAYSRAWGMPRPRNVLIPAIMTAIAMGYKEIYLAGADHSWMKTLHVDSDNHVVTVQPHFYADSAAEQQRVDTLYSTLPLHSVVHSFYVAFKAYHQISRYARTHDINIYNSTPESMIDAFTRRPLPDK